MASQTVALFATLLCACSAQPAAVPPALPPVAATQPPPHPDRSKAPIWTVTATQPECRQAPDDGDTLYRLQSAMNPLLAQAETDPSFGGAWIDYSPCYRLVLGFADGHPRQWLIDAAAPELRPLIAFALIPYSRSGQERLRNDVGAVLGRGGIKAIFVEAPDQRPQVGVMTEEDARLARAILPPHLLDKIDIYVGDIHPKPE